MYLVIHAPHPMAMRERLEFGNGAAAWAAYARLAREEWAEREYRLLAVDGRLLLHAGLTLPAALAVLRQAEGGIAALVAPADGCRGKERFPSYHAAEQALSRRRGRRHRDPATLQIYRCGSCGEWHHGGAAARARRKRPQVRRFARRGPKAAPQT